MLTNVRSDRVAAVRGLRQGAVRERTGRFLVEGPQGVREAVRYAAERVHDLYLTEAAAGRYAVDIVQPALAAGLRVHSVSEQVLAAMCDAQTPQGVAAVVEVAHPTLEAVLAAKPTRLVLLHEVRDPGNAGTVIRAADAAGFDAVLLSASSVDVTAPKVVRSTAGSIFHVPVVTALQTPATLEVLRAHGIRSLAADGAGPVTLGEADLSGAHVWLFGTEATGLPDGLRDACDTVVTVPIHGKAESLNLAMAATVCLYASAGV